MLILSRKPQESIIINDDIHIQVLCYDSKHVKLGIDAPRHISVHRSEIYWRILRNRAYAEKIKAIQQIHYAM